MTVWNRTVDKAREVVGDLTKDVRAYSLEALTAALQPGDIAISMLPADQHVAIAKAALSKGANFASSSYVAPEMRALDSEFKGKGLVSINEVGLDPGIDHLMAHDLVARYRASTAYHPDNVVSFTSYCGGIPKTPNPFRYKFSWAPVGVLKALRSPSRSLKDFKEWKVDRPWNAISRYEAPLPQAGEFRGLPEPRQLPVHGRLPLRQVLEGQGLRPRHAAPRRLGEGVGAGLPRDRNALAARPATPASPRWRPASSRTIPTRRANPTASCCSSPSKAERDGRAVFDEVWSLDAWGDQRGSAMGRLVSYPGVVRDRVGARTAKSPPASTAPRATRRRWQAGSARSSRWRSTWSGFPVRGRGDRRYPSLPARRLPGWIVGASMRRPPVAPTVVPLHLAPRSRRSTLAQGPIVSQPGTDMPASAPAIELRGIDKRFGPVHANKAIDLKVEKGSIHGIVGENGAGKSTLMSILYGFYQADAGEIFVNGEKTPIKTPSQAIAAGIGMVHQHFMLVEPFTVLENVVLGAEGGEVLAGGIGKARAALEKLGRDYEMTVPLDTPVGELAVGQQQRVEILKALYRGAEVLILDEPTGVLTPGEADHLFKVLATLRAQGKTVILITHKLREIMAITDRVSVMRRGEMVATRETKATSPAELAELMVGRSVLLKVDRGATAHASSGRVVLDVRNLGLVDSQGVERLKGATFQVRAGEIVGIAGVAGNGQSELIEVISGIKRATSGEIILNGETLSGEHLNPKYLREKGVGHVPEDRHRRALVMTFDAAENAMLGYHHDDVYGRGILLDREAILADTGRKMEEYDVRPPDVALRANLFSGGNQQKLVLAREMARNPDLLIVGQPTRGVDIGAIEFIHKRLLAMRDAGKAILLVSVELDEIRALSDRILVMCAGEIGGECAAGASENEIGLLMAGITAGGAKAA